jgi:hypothetical protein
VFDYFVGRIKVAIEIVQDHSWLPVKNIVVLYYEKEFSSLFDYFDLMIDIELKSLVEEYSSELKSTDFQSMMMVMNSVWLSEKYTVTKEYE